MRIDLQQRPQGVVLRIRAQAGARSNQIRGSQDGALKVAITQVAEKGKANKAILELLAKQLDLRKSQLEIISGETSSQKQVLVRDISLEELTLRLSPCDADQ